MQSAQRLKSAVLPLALLSCLLLATWDELAKLLLRWQGGDNSYCWLVPPLFIWLSWEQRRLVRPGEFAWSPRGLLPLCLSALLAVIGVRGAVETLVYIGLWGMVCGLLVVFYGRRARHLFFAMLVLLFIVPLPPMINRLVTVRLKVGASALATHWLQLSGVSALREGNLIDLGVTQLQVVDACSGLRYVLPLLLLTLLMGRGICRGWWRRLTLIILAVPVSILLNALRIYAGGLCVVHGHPAWTGNTAHDLAGWLLFLVAGAILFICARILRTPATTDPGTPDPVTPAPTRRAAAMTILVCALVLCAGQLMEPARAAAPPRTPFAEFPLDLGPWHGEPHALSPEIRASLWADDVLNITYTRPDAPGAVTLFIPYYSYQTTRHTAHAPRSCLLGGGWLPEADGTLTFPGPHSDVTIHTLVLKKPGTRLLAAYCFWQRGRIITNPWANKAWLMCDALTTGRTDGALIRAEMIMPADYPPEEAATNLNDFLTRAWPLLPEYLPE